MPDPLEHPLIAQLLRSFLDRTRDHAVLCLDAQGVVVGWLGAAERIFGYGADEVVGRSGALIFTPEDRDKGFDDYELLVARTTGHCEDERWHVRKDGTRIWATGTVEGFFDAQGKLQGYVKMLQDRTDQRAHIESLNNTVTSLREARERTQKSLGTLGHELKNPLAPISNAARIIGKLSADHRTDRAVALIDSQVAVMARLANDLMDIGRVGTGKLVLQLQPADLRRLLAEVVDGMRSTAAQRQQDLQAVLPDVPLPVKADPQRVQQVILNLLGNAMKYTPAGGNIWVRATQEGPDTVFFVEDTGIGIAPDVLPRIFDLFTQEGEAAAMAPGGLGVGLAMVRHIVELHGGTVQARSAGKGRGAEFSVRLPGSSG
jgi:PAS domain S-box-containing protein